MIASQSTSFIRPLGPFEAYFEASYQALGAYNLTATYTLNAPISLQDLRQAAQYLRARHKILQTAVILDWDNSAAHFIEADHLQIRVERYEGPLTLPQLISSLTEPVSSPASSNSELRAQRLQHRTAHLPWGLTLFQDRAVVLVTTHSICDGVSCDIIGADLIRSLNKQSPPSSIPIAPPLEVLFGPITFLDRLTARLSFIKSRFQSVQTVGLQPTWPSDWRLRKPIRHTLDISMSDLSRFHARCKNEHVTLTSGIVSSFYTALGNRQDLNVSDTNMPLYVAMDARRRIAPLNGLTLDTVGVYNGGMSVEHDARGSWEDRARAVQQSVEEVGMEEAFRKSQIQCEIELVRGLESMTCDASDGKCGRIFPTIVSNIGRAWRIEAANEEFGEGVNVDSMDFDISHKGLGAFFLLHICTVGDIMKMGIKSYRPFVDDEFVEALGNDLESMLID